MTFSYGLFAAAFVQIMSLQGIGRSWSGFLLALSRVAVAIPAAYLLLLVLRLPLAAGWLAVAVVNAADGRDRLPAGAGQPARPGEPAGSPESVERRSRE